MASKRVTKLKWVDVEGTGEKRCGPFRLEPFGTHGQFVARVDGLAGYVVSESEAKRACERLAARILGAMKGSQ